MIASRAISSRSRSRSIACCSFCFSCRPARSSKCSCSVLRRSVIFVDMASFPQMWPCWSRNDAVHRLTSISVPSLRCFRTSFSSYETPCNCESSGARNSHSLDVGTVGTGRAYACEWNEVASLAVRHRTKNLEHSDPTVRVTRLPAQHRDSPGSDHHQRRKRIRVFKERLKEHYILLRGESPCQQIVESVLKFVFNRIRVRDDDKLCRNPGLLELILIVRAIVVSKVRTRRGLATAAEDIADDTAALGKNVKLRAEKHWYIVRQSASPATERSQRA